jgi:hypothetical protein
MSLGPPEESNFKLRGMSPCWDHPGSDVNFIEFTGLSPSVIKDSTLLNSFFKKKAVVFRSPLLTISIDLITSVTVMFHFTEKFKIKAKFCKQIYLKNNRLLLSYR